jgi:hypothetical protein
MPSAAGPRCAVCRHPQLNLITTDLAAGLSLRAVARKYSLTHETVRTHRNRHMGSARWSTIWSSRFWTRSEC